MSKIWLSALVLALVATTASAQDARYANQDAGDNAHYGWANVLRVDPVYAVTRTNMPSQQCYQQPVVRQDPGNSTASTLLGAVVGGVLGHTIGRGDGRVAATVAGAVAGGAVGNHVSDHGGSYESTQTECQQVNTVSEQRQIVGYDVEYRYRGDVYMSRLSYDPGDRLRVRVSVTPAD
ncbi:glycine zipper 2TM domain-containing protein [Dyella sp. A6]|uniref:glycine zipper 2TM domain-containing protein n=1 Tax=Dyella aluminiiresistens TaxID=3069105 RepID=UPI002E79AA01|nr:glycine zipper 2TM domain-containing protein [Dyella sp. A6]